MKTFRTGKVIRRVVTIKTSVRGMPDRQWVIEMGASGLRFRRFGTTQTVAALTWRQAIGIALVHA